MKVRAFAMSLVLGIAAMGSLTPAAHAASASPATYTADCNAISSTNGANDTTFSGQVGDTFQITASGGTCLFKELSGSSSNLGTWPTFLGYSSLVTPTGLTLNGDLWYVVSGSAATFTILSSGAFTISSGGGHGSTITVIATEPALTTPAPPTPQTVTFQTPLGATCTTATDLAGNPYSSSVTVTPQWVSVPTCTREGSTFLGWSTSPIFPVSVAQEQVAARYGAWDGTANGMRMIFIPHYWHTYISADNTLYGVWG